jgi:DNA-binding SARP family transcriptional activator
MQYNDKVVVTFPTRHVEELLGYLLLNQQEKHSREKLMSILWPNSAPDKARSRFSTELWRLRVFLDNLGLASEQYLQTTREWVAFTPVRPLYLDLHSFEAYLSQAQLATEQAVREKALAAAVCLYQGELFEGIYSDWCLAARERVARRRLRALGQLMAGCMQRQAYEEAIDWGQTILQEDPLREEVHRAIMQCYWHRGLRAQAIRQFQICAQRLMEELQVLPMPETIALYRQIIEDRLKNRQSQNGNNGRQKQLQIAFRQFQQAGDRLNALLEGADSMD